MPAGRPPKLDLIVRHRDVYEGEGPNRRVTGREPVTLIDSICADLAAGLPAHRAARRAGISSVSFYEYEKVAGRARTKLVANPAAPLTPYERGCIEFSNRVNAAELEWELAQNVTLERLARGGMLVERTIERPDPADPSKMLVVERRVEHTLPDAKTIITRLKLRFPKDYAERQIVAGDGEDGAIPVEIRAQALADAIRQARAEKRPARSRKPKPAK